MKYQKSISAPKTFPTKKKERKYVINPNPGPHPKSECIPLGVIIRDILPYAETLKEARQILNNSEVLVDGKVKKDYKYPVGIFDVIEFPKIGRSLRVIPTKDGFKLIEISEKEKDKKLCKIISKTSIKRDQIQFNLSDGKNILGGSGSPNDSLLINLEEMEMENSFERKRGNTVIITRGKNRGKLGKIIDIEIVKGSGLNRILIEVEDSEIDVPEDMVFIVGEDEPAIKVME